MAKSNTPKSNPASGKGSKRNQPPPPQTWREKAAAFLGATETVDPKTGKKRRVSRKERDDKRTRNLYIILGVLGAAAVLLFSGALINDYFLKPRKVLATVEGEDITRRDYWKYEMHTLSNQVLQYQQFATMMQGQEQQQYLAMAQQAQIQLDNVWGSTSTNDATLSRMIDDKVIMNSLDSLGLSINDEQVDEFIAQQFANPAAPVSSPTPTQTLIPERAEWATQTAVSEAEFDAEGLGEIGEGDLPAGSPEAIVSPAAESSPQAGSPVPAASPSSDGTPIPMATQTGGTPEPTATVGPDDARATSAANFADYSDDMLDRVHMSESDYRRLIAEPTLARQMINAHFLEELGQSAEQVHARHILVGTQELADALYAQLQEDPEMFELLAQESSVDTSTAPNGGDLGWFPRGIMVDAFEEVAFTLEPGQISEPVPSEFGWHIIQVLDHDEDRALTEQQIGQASQALSERWLESQFESLDISSSIEPTPTQTINQFVPPADAPPVPTTVMDDGSPVALPEASPQVIPAASPGEIPAASPVAEAEGTPAPAASPEAAVVASPAASPAASPVASPIASPAGG